MKVLVMKHDAWRGLAYDYPGTVTAMVATAFREVDIPEGCALAVVRDIHTGRKFDDKFELECFNVGRIVQEVKL